MRNITLAIVILFSLLVFGCIGQDTNTQSNSGNEDSQKILINESVTGSNLSTQTGSESIECDTGMTWSTSSDGYTSSGTIVGVETYKGKRVCHVTATIEGGYGNIDVYIDMTNSESACTVMNIGGQTTETCVNWE